MKIDVKFKDWLKNFKNASFVLKFTAMLLDFINILVWRLPEDGSSGTLEAWEECVFAHSVPAYLVVLSGMVVIHSLGELPGKWFHRLFLGLGVVLFATTAINALLNYLQYPESMGNYSWFIIILCFLIAIIMILDIVLQENFCGLVQKSKTR